MPDRSADFVPIARLLSPPAAAPETAQARQVDEIDAARPSPERDDPSRAALRDVRIFRAALADAFEAELSDLSRDVAIAILARELELETERREVVSERVVELARDAEALGGARAVGEELLGREELSVHSCKLLAGERLTRSEP